MTTTTFRRSAEVFSFMVAMLTLATALGAPARGADPEPRAAGKPAAVDGWRPLFNGENLDGWYLFLQKHGRDHDPDRVVAIDSGVIHVYKFARNGAEVVMGYMGTKEFHKDYHFRLQYRWGKKQFRPRYLYKPDAGIYYHHDAPDLVWPQAMQFQLELNGVGDLLTVGAVKVETTVDPALKTDDWLEYLPPERGGAPFETPGKGVSYIRKLDNFEKDGWNTLDLICKGDEAVQMVNGRVAARCRKIRRQDPDDPNRWIPLTAGRILIEFEASEIYYRNIAVRSLAPEESLDAAVAGAASAR